MRHPSPPTTRRLPAAVPRDRWRILRPLAHRDFRALFIAVVLSIFAAGMWAVVMVYAVIAIGGGPVDLSLVAASNATGLLLCAIPGGIVADRVSRRMIVRAVSLADFLAITSVVVVGAFGPVGIPQLVVVAFILGAGAGFFFPAYSAILPRLLPPGQLLAANGLEGAIRPALQQAAGPAAAGMLLAALIPAHAAVVIAIAHGAAFVILMFLRPEPAQQPWEHSDSDDPEAADHSAKSVFHDLREAVVFTVRTPWLLWTLLYATLWVLVVVGPEEVLLPFLIRERIGEDPRLFGFLLAVYGAGGVLGSIFVSSRKLPRRYLTTMNLVWGVSTLPFIIVGFTDQYWLLMAVAVHGRLRVQLRQCHLGDPAAAARAPAHAGPDLEPGLLRLARADAAVDGARRTPVRGAVTAGDLHRGGHPHARLRHHRDLRRTHAAG